MTSKVYKSESGQWAFIILDESGVDIVRGAGYETQEEAKQAADDQLANYR
jgi:uncharacterized protein YegP (UPF0339 family)